MITCHKTNLTDNTNSQRCLGDPEEDGDRRRERPFDDDETPGDNDDDDDEEGEPRRKYKGSSSSVGFLFSKFIASYVMKTYRFDVQQFFLAM